MAQIRQTVFHNPTLYLQRLQDLKISQINSNNFKVDNALKIIHNNEVDECLQKKKCDNSIKFKYIKLCQWTMVKLLNKKTENSQILKKLQIVKKKKKQIEQQESFIEIMKKQVREERQKLSNIIKNQKKKRAYSIRNEPQNSQKKQEGQNLRKTVQRASSVSKPQIQIKDQEMDINQTTKTNQSQKLKTRNYKYAGKNCQSEKGQNNEKQNQVNHRNRLKDYQQKLFEVGRSLRIEKKEIKPKPVQIQQVEVVDFDLDMPLTLSMHSIKQLKKKKQSQITYPPKVKQGSGIIMKMTTSTLKYPQIEAVQNEEDFDFQGFQLKQKSNSSKKSLVDIDVSSQQDQQPSNQPKQQKNLNQSCKIMPKNSQPKPNSKFGIKDSFYRQIEKMDLQSRKRLANKHKPENQLQQINEEQDLRATVKSHNVIRKF